MIEVKGNQSDWKYKIDEGKITFGAWIEYFNYLNKTEKKDLKINKELKTFFNTEKTFNQEQPTYNILFQTFKSLLKETIITINNQNSSDKTELLNFLKKLELLTKNIERLQKASVSKLDIAFLTGLCIIALCAVILTFTLNISPIVAGCLFAAAGLALAGTGIWLAQYKFTMSSAKKGLPETINDITKTHGSMLQQNFNFFKQSGVSEAAQAKQETIIKIS